MAYVDDDMDEDFVPPGKRRRSPRRPVKVEVATPKQPKGKWQ